MTAKIQHSPMAKLPVARLLEREECSPGELAKRLSIHPRQVYRAQTEGGVHCWTADRWAIALGWHPREIWGDLWWNLACDMQDAWDARLAREKADSVARHAYNKRLKDMFGAEWQGRFCGRHPSWSAREPW